MQDSSSNVLKGRLKHSVAGWCFEKHWSIEELCDVAVKLGIKSIELAPPEQWPVLEAHGLVCGLTISHWFEKGMNNTAYHAECIGQMREAIDASAAHGFPNVLTFTGFGEGLSLDEGLKNCVSGYKEIIGYAEEKGIVLCLEMLNSRVAIEMQGHPGYQGDHVDYVMDIVKQVGSPNLKLLFDVYHVQIMDGDVISRIREYAEYIGHVHTAGVPGRNEIGANQEINYPAVMRALADAGYTEYVGHEFLPTGDPLEGLREAVALCDV